MKTTVRVGQEWMKKDTNRNSDTRIRVLEAPSGSRVKVGTVTKDGRAVRHREILVSALSNTPKGYRLKKDVPAKEPRAATLDDLRNSAALPAPSPLARVAGNVTSLRDRAHPADVGLADEVLDLLMPMSRALPVLLQAFHEHNRAPVRPTGHASALASDCPECRALLESK